MVAMPNLPTNPAPASPSQASLFDAPPASDTAPDTVAPTPDAVDAAPPRQRRR